MKTHTLIFSSRRRFASFGAFAGLCLLLAIPASLRAADYTYTQSFNSPLGGLPANWNRNSGFSTNNGVSEIVLSGGENWLRQQRTNGPTGNSFVYYNGDFGDGAVVGGILSDFTVSSSFKISGGLTGDGRGMMLRAQETDATPLGYFIYINAGQMHISLNPTDATSGRGTLLATSSQNFTSLISGEEYLFNASAIGTTISGALYAWDTETSSFSTLLASVSVVNSTYSSGLFGFRSSFTDSARSAFWQDSTIVAVPEPSAVPAMVLLLSVSGLCLLRRSWRKQPAARGALGRAHEPLPVQAAPAIASQG